MRTVILFSLLFLPVMSHSQHIISGGDTTSILAKYRTKNISIANPFPGNNLLGHIWEVGRDFVITKVVAVLQGSDSPSVTWSLRHHMDRSNAGTELVTNGSTTTSTTAGNTVSSGFNDASVSANEFVWITVSATGGVVDAIHFTIYYYLD